MTQNDNLTSLEVKNNDRESIVPSTASLTTEQVKKYNDRIEEESRQEIIHPSVDGN
ncbi:MULTISPECIES: hypothetical protein [unclassified Paenibacillus]|uniref:hypothetical protein n=1 Tax=unclassified Paenibacillus TaxID=185978 RepID=UPI00277F5AE6|nr:MULTISPECIES: hypothetical protein [unclassified Paenibacillus]MDQ0899102.1 hypothetical protein [Paenibacillus sp. V4I7]MDQ0914915.1 hypothetical protein [Paenibacillus sp. V4I5]